MQEKCAVSRPCTYNDGVGVLSYEEAAALTGEIPEASEEGGGNGKTTAHREDASQQRNQQLVTGVEKRKKQLIEKLIK